MPPEPKRQAEVEAAPLRFTARSEWQCPRVNRLLGVKGRSFMLKNNTTSLEEPPPGSAGWLAIHTRHQHESLAARSLAYKGFEVFLPQYTSVRQWSDRTRELTAPLFPG